jgi:crotonobetainyl-CoA:carnitine CoA-transferase CaiB-like acyl-CoA transferase
MGGLLDGIKVLDLTLQLPGPFCSMIMADYGAKVVKIDEPYPRKRMSFGESRGPGVSPGEIYLNRNKKSLTLNLKSEEGKEIFYRMASGADVVLEGFRPGVASRLGVDYERVAEINPSIVYCSISGFGQTGPRKNQAAHDLNYISLTGILGICGEKGRTPVIPPVQVADLGGGSFMALAGILMALLARKSAGKGQYVDVSMFDGSLSWLSVHAASYLMTNELPRRGEMPLTGLLPGYALYRCKDGRYLSVGALEEWFFDRLCEILGRPDLAGNATVPDAEGKIREQLQGEFGKRERAEWMELLEGEDVCVSAVHDFAEAFDDPHTIAREMVVNTSHPDFGKIRQPGFPIKFSDSSGCIRMRAPYLGEHNREILLGLGLGENEISRLVELKVIRDFSGPGEK